MANRVLEYIIQALDQTGPATKSAEGNARSASSSILSQMANIKAAWDMATGAIKAGAQMVWSTIKEAFKFETVTLQFSILMGSMDKARDRMKELAKFAAETPFEMEGIAKASRTLHVFSEGALGDAGSLRLIGDAAAATGQDLADLSFWVGRAYSMIKGGQPFGEAAMRLQEMGIMTPQARAKMEELQAAGAKTSEVWGVLVNKMDEFSGGMKKMSVSGDGLLSTLEDTAKEARRTFGQEFLDAAKTAIDGITKYLAGLIEDGSIKKWADKALEQVYRVAGAVKAIWEGGKERDLAWGAVKDVVVGFFELAANRAMNIMLQYGPQVGLAIGNALYYVATKIGKTALQENVDHAQYVQAARETGVFKEDSLSDMAFERLHQKWWTIPEDKKEAFEKRSQELINEKYLNQNKYTPLELSSSKMDHGLATLSLLAQGLKDKVKGNADEFKNILEGAGNKPKTPAKIDPKVQAALDAADVALQKKRLVEEEKKRIETAEKVAEAEKKALDERLKDERAAKIDAARDAAKAGADEERAGQDRLTRAKAAAEQAWGWYRDPASFKKQLEEEKAQKAAEKQYEKDFSSLSRRGEWRTTTRLNDSEEAVRRVALAREEQKAAERALIEIAKNTAGLEAMLKELLSSK